MADEPFEFGRRQFIASAMGAAALGGTVKKTIAQINEKESRPGTFGDRQAEVFSVWCDLLAPGASAAGVVRFVDKYISGAYPDALLFLRFFQGMPLADFYTSGLMGVDQESVAQFEKPFLGLTPTNRKIIVEAAVTFKTRVWPAPDAFLFYLVTRNDAVDVVYGTERGFEALDIPYLAHISPDRPW